MDTVEEIVTKLNRSSLPNDLKDEVLRLLEIDSVKNILNSADLALDEKLRQLSQPEAAIAPGSYEEAIIIGIIIGMLL